MKVLLIQPPLISFTTMVAPNLGLALIAAVLEQDGCEVRVIDAAAENITLDEIINRAREFSPDVAGAGGQTPISHQSLEIFRRLKREVGRSIITIAGGPHFTFTAEESLLECPELDIVVRGEGEYTIRDLCRRLAAGQGLDGVAGITRRTDKGQIVTNPDREPIEDINSLPFPAWHLFPIKKYHWTGINMLGAITSRGCRYGCPHCVTWKMHKGVRFRDPAKIVEELVWVKKMFGIDTFYFHDDAAFTDRQQLEGFLDALERSGETLYWYYESRDDTFFSYQDLWPRMKKNGLFKIALGLDTPNAAARRFYGRKALNLEETERMLSFLKHEIGIQVSVYLLLGSPDETEQSMLQTVNYAKHLYPRFCTFVMGTFVTPFPGTEIFKTFQEKNLLTTRDWKKYGFGMPVFKMRIAPEKASRMYSKLWMDVYARPVVLREIFSNLVSRNRFRRALAKNFLLMPLQMVKLSRIKTG